MTTQQMLDKIAESILDKMIEYGVRTEKLLGCSSLLSLSRVLNVLEMYSLIRGDYAGEKDHTMYIRRTLNGKNRDGIERKLLNDSGSDAYLNDQSEQTIKAIREIVCK